MKNLLLQQFRFYVKKQEQVPENRHPCYKNQDEEKCCLYLWLAILKKEKFFNRRTYFLV